MEKCMKKHAAVCTKDTILNSYKDLKTRYCKNAVSLLAPGNLIL